MKALFKNKVNILKKDKHGVVLMLIAIFSVMGILLPEWAAIFFALVIQTVVIWIMFLARALENGYRYENHTIVFHRKFRKHVIEFKQINFLVISNSYINAQGGRPLGDKNMAGKIVIAPWCTVVCGEYDEAEITKWKFDKDLTSRTVEKEKLKNVSFFGFVVRKQDIRDFMNQYEGKIYIAYSVYLNYAKEIKLLLEYGVLRKNQLIIMNNEV